MVVISWSFPSFNPQSINLSNSLVIVLPSMLPLFGMLFLRRFVRPLLLPPSENGSKPTFTPSLPSLVALTLVFSVVLNFFPSLDNDIFRLFLFSCTFLLGRLSVIKVQLELELVAMDNSTMVAYINKQGGTHSAEMCTVEDHDMVQSLSHNIKSQMHSRVSECDGQPSVQVEPSAVNRMFTASAGVLTDLSKVVHSSCRSIWHSSEPQTSTVHISSPRPKYLGHRCSELKLDETHCLCLPSNGSPSQGDPKNQAMPLPDHRNSPRWPGVPWFWDLVQLSTEIQLQFPVIMTLLKQSNNYVFHSNPQHLNLHAWCLRVDSSKNKASLWEVAERIAAPQRSPTRTIYKSKWALLRNGAEKIWWIFPLHL